MSFRGGGVTYNPAPVRVFSNFTWLGLFSPFLGDLFSLNSSLARYRFENKSPKNFFAHDRNNNVTNCSPLTVHRLLINETAFSLFTSHFSLPKKPAFTMAEVLITLGIIGIVAAMTLPIIVGKYQKQVTISKLQKVYSILNQALERSEVDHEAYRYWPSAFDMGDENYFNIYWKPYLKVSHICKTYKDCGYKSNTPWIQQNGKPITLSLVAPGARTTFFLEDGTLIVMLSAGGGSEGTLVKADEVYVDINGPGNPNKMGRDVFILVKTDEEGAKGFMPYGYGRKDINKGCSRTNTGSFCLAKIMADGWKIEDDYPW